MNERQTKRISFETGSNDPTEPVNNKSVKISNDKSRFAQKTNRKALFEQQAKDTHEKREGYQYEAIKLGQEFNSFFNNKTLLKNKGPLEKSFEREIISKLITYAIKVNNDDSEPNDGMGSVALITLLINTILTLKDQLNSVEYNNHLLEKELVQMKTSINDIINKISKDE